jgi:hypothetical protein
MLVRRTCFSDHHNIRHRRGRRHLPRMLVQCTKLGLRVDRRVDQGQRIYVLALWRGRIVWTGEWQMPRIPTTVHLTVQPRMRLRHISREKQG